MARHVTSRLAIGIALVTLAACGGKDDPLSAKPKEEQPGQGCPSAELGNFSGNASGAASGKLAGCAYYLVETDNEDGSSAFGLVLMNGAPLSGTPVINIAVEGGRPAVGTYSIGLDTAGFFGGVFVEGSRNFLASSGSITIKSSSASGVSGSVSLSASEVGSNAQISISGDFSAKCLKAESSSSTFSC